MRQAIRGVTQVLPEEQIPAFAAISGNAYPGIGVTTAEEREKFGKSLQAMRESDPAMEIYGHYRDEKLVGGMILYDYQMNLFGDGATRLPVGGVGMVGVDLLHKKEHVAKDMLTDYMHHYKERGFPLLALYPFRVDFYQKMGFGLATKMSQYRLHPADLPSDQGKRHVRFLTADDREAVQACYRRAADRTHGFFDKTIREMNRLFSTENLRIVGVEKDGELTGYLVFLFQSGSADNFLLNDLIVQEMIYESPEALGELMAFLHAQADQIRHVVINTQDESFHYLPRDARYAPGSRMIPSVYHESHHSGLGLMYRVLDVKGLFEALGDHDFNGQNVRLKLTVRDSFLPENDGSVLLDVTGGRARVAEQGGHDVELEIGVSDFSSLIMGGVDLKSLWRYSRAKLSDPARLGQLNRLFAVEEKPQCLSRF